LKDYSTKRRTAVVFAGTGTSGAYHAGVLKALDESGIKVDLVVGSGIGTLAAAFGAVAGGARLANQRGFWASLRGRDLYRLRPALRALLLAVGLILVACLLPLGLALLAGLALPLLLLLDAMVAGAASSWLAQLPLSAEQARLAYLVALAAPAFVLSLIVFGTLIRLGLRRKRAGELLESVLDVRPGLDRLAEALWEVSRGSALSPQPPSEQELGRRYVGLLRENLGEPGFRELILRVSDLDTGETLPFVLLGEPYRAGFDARLRVDGLPRVIDLLGAGNDALLFDAVASGLCLHGLTPVRRVAFPRGGLHGGETHRVAEAGLGSGAGIAEALAAGAEQVLLVTAVSEGPRRPSRRRGVGALLDAAWATLERQGIQADVATTERLSRIVSTVGGEAGWQDPANGRRYSDVALWVVRPERRGIGPLEFDGARDPATEVDESVEDLIERGRRDAFRQFVEPVVGGAPMPVRADDEGRLVEL
jgi:hypothetical protein